MKGKLLLPQIEATLKAGGYFRRMKESDIFCLLDSTGAAVGVFNLARFNTLVLKLGTQLQENDKREYRYKKRERWER